MQTVPSDDFDWVRCGQAGVVTTTQAVECLGPVAIRSHLRAGRWRRICRGVLLTENGMLRPEQKLWVAVLVAGADAWLAGQVAATEAGVKGLRSEPIDVLIPAKRGRSTRLPALPPDMSAVRVHRTTRLPALHCQATRPPRTSVARSIIDAAAWASRDDEARDLIARACQQRLVTATQLCETLTLFPSIRRHQLIKITIADIKGGADALSEIDFLALCRRYRLPLPDMQQPRLDQDGRKRFVDAYWKDARLMVEVDGAHHIDISHWTADMLRQNRLWIAGDRVLRYPS